MHGTIIAFRISFSGMVEHHSVSVTLMKLAQLKLRTHVNETGPGPLISFPDPIVMVYSGIGSIMRPLIHTAEIRLQVGDSVFLQQQTIDGCGFAYSADGGGVLTFKGEFLGP